MFITVFHQHLSFSGGDLDLPQPSEGGPSRSRGVSRWLQWNAARAEHKPANDIHEAPLTVIHSEGQCYLPVTTDSSADFPQQDKLEDSVFCQTLNDSQRFVGDAHATTQEGSAMTHTILTTQFQLPRSPTSLAPKIPLYSIDENLTDSDSSYSSTEEMQMYLSDKEPTLTPPVPMRLEFTPPPLCRSLSESLQSPGHLSDLREKRASSCDSVVEVSDATANPTIPKPRPRPRKSSLVLPGNRKSLEESGRRRSVHFQPEVILQHVVIEGDVEGMKDVLSSEMKSAVNRMSPVGLTALHQAAVDGNVECANVLVLNGADVNVQDCEGWTPLHAAAVEGHTEFVHFLLMANADPNIRSDDEETACDLAKKRMIRKMLSAAMNGKFLELYSEPYSVARSDTEDSCDEDETDQEGYDDDRESNGDDETSDFLKQYHTQSVKNLVSGRRKAASQQAEEAREFVRQSEGQRTRMVSSSLSSIDSLDLSTMADEDNKDHRITATEVSDDVCSEEDQGISTMEGSSDGSIHLNTAGGYTLDSDLQEGSPDYMFQDAVLSGDVEGLAKLIRIREHIDVNRVNQSSKVSALHHSVLEENFTMIRHLVKDFVCDINLEDEDGWTPLHAASAVGNIQVAQFLLENGAKPSILNKQCEFPVDISQDKAMEQLLKRAMLGPPSGKVNNHS